MSGVNNTLFKISKQEHRDNLARLNDAVGQVHASLEINKDSDILKGHFPGQPVIPGACMLQIVKEVLEDALAASMRLKKADHLKFIVMIDPATTHTVLLDLAYKVVTEDSLNVTAKIVNGEVVCFKFQGTFIRE